MVEQRLIDAESVVEFIKSVDIDSTENAFNKIYIVDLIESRPTVDAVPVVRCKDCIHYEDVGYCDMRPYEERKSVNYYCADGERNDGESE